MKRLAAISTLLARLTIPVLTISVLSIPVLSIPVLAQHGGGHAGGGGGFSGHGGGGFSGGSRSGPAPRAGSHPSVARPGVPSGYRSGYQPGHQPGYQAGYQARPGIAPRSFAGPGMQTTTVSPYRQAYRSPNDPENRRWNQGGVVYENHRDHRPGHGSGYRDGYQSGYIGPYFGGYPYGLGFYGGDGYYDDSINYGADQGDNSGQSYNQDNGPDPYYRPDQYNGFDPQGNYPPPPGYRIEYEDQGQYQDQAQVQGPEPGQDPNQIPPGAAYQPNYGPQDSPSGPQRNPISRQAARPNYQSSQGSSNHDVPNQPAVTLVFKDNRPNQVIHNYLINGSTLTVWDQSAHDIPVGELNVEATRKINRDQGVDFFLPSASR